MTHVWVSEKITFGEVKAQKTVCFCIRLPTKSTWDGETTCVVGFQVGGRSQVSLNAATIQMKMLPQGSLHLLSYEY